MAAPSADTLATLEKRYRLACEQYAEWGVDAPRAVERLGAVAVSLQCWQGDDVRGFEGAGAEIGGGLAVTGAYPGRARNADELQSDLEMACSLIPGRHRVNLHASYADHGGRRVDRDALSVDGFTGWIDWARARRLGLDFNPTFFAHPLAADGWTLSHADPAVRRFWIDHGRACRRIGAAFGAALGSPCVTNVWIPDGMKDVPIDRKGPRGRLCESLDAMFAEPLDGNHLRDAVEGKLFGIGSESYVVGSQDFYLGYALSRRTLLCLDMGHYHPTESVADKISALLGFLDGVLLHVSRGIRWDSDHVVTLTDELEALAQELVRGDALGRVHLGLDYFDASVNRVAAWVVGTRALLKALLLAFLEPLELLREVEAGGDYTARLAWGEEAKALPHGAIWDHWCARHGVPTGRGWLEPVRAYERDVLARRG